MYIYVYKYRAHVESNKKKGITGTAVLSREKKGEKKGVGTRTTSEKS